VALRLAEADVAELVMRDVVETDMEELGEAIVALEGDGRGVERGTGVVPDGEGAEPSRGRVGMDGLFAVDPRLTSPIA